MTLTVSVPPSAEPISTAEAKTHLRETLSDATNNTYIDTIVEAARIYAENLTGAILTQRTLVWTIDGFPDSSDLPLIIPASPVQSIVSVVYTDNNGNPQTWSSANYKLDPNYQRPRILPAYGENWPSDVRDEINSVQITFKAGFSNEDVSPAETVPEAILRALRLMIGHWYENRMEVVQGAPAQQIPLAAHHLLAPYRVHRF